MGVGDFLVVPLHFLALKAQLVVLVSAFVMVSTVCLVSLLFAVRLRTVPPCMHHGVGATDSHRRRHRYKMWETARVVYLRRFE